MVIALNYSNSGNLT